MRLVKITHQEYCALAEAGAWVQWDSTPLLPERQILKMRSSAEKTSALNMFRAFEDYVWYTRTEDDAPGQSDA